MDALKLVREYRRSGLPHRRQLGVLDVPYPEFIVLGLALSEQRDQLHDAGCGLGPRTESARTSADAESAPCGLRGVSLRNADSFSWSIRNDPADRSAERRPAAIQFRTVFSDTPQ